MKALLSQRTRTE